MKTLQQIFDQGLAHIRKQGGPCLKQGKCAYRDGKGNACIVGGLIADVDYVDWWDENDGLTVLALSRSKSGDAALRKAGIDPSRSGVRTLLIDMQDAHDIDPCEEYMPLFEMVMARVAKKHGLTYTPPEPEHAPR